MKANFYILLFSEKKVFNGQINNPEHGDTINYSFPNRLLNNSESENEHLAATDDRNTDTVNKNVNNTNMNENILIKQEPFLHIDMPELFENINENTSEIGINNRVATKSDLENMKESIFYFIEENIIKRLDILEKKAVETKNLISENKPLTDEKNIMSFNTIQELYDNISFPIKILSEFEEFNKHIEMNASDLKTNLIKHFSTIFHPQKDLIECIRFSLKKFVGKDVLMTFSAQKKTSDKNLFKDLPFYSCIFNSIIKVYSNYGIPVDEKIVLKSIGHVLNGVKDWDGGRLDRSKKSN